MVIIWVGIRVAFGVDNPLYHVASDSMVPNLNVGDFVIINHNVPFDQLKVGDIIVFKSPEIQEDGKQETIVHRIAKIQTDVDGNRVVRTKGDANAESIPGIDYPIREGNYLGKVTFVIPKLRVNYKNTITADKLHSYRDCSRNFDIITLKLKAKK